MVQFELSNPGSVPAGFELGVSIGNADLRAKFYDPADAGSQDCWDDHELPQTSVVVPAGVTVTRRALVSNVGLGTTLSVQAEVTSTPLLEIVTPDDAYRLGDTVDFRADLTGLQDPSGIDIEWSATDAEDQDVSLPFTTASGETESYGDLPCTDLLVRAEATLPGGETVFDVRPVSCVPPTETYVYDVNRTFSGMVTSDGRALNGDDIEEILIGDDTDDNGLTGLLHFDLPTLPDDLEEIVSATLVLGFETPVGSPNQDLGAMRLYPADYGTSFEASDYLRGGSSTTTLRPVSPLTVSSTGFGTTDVPVTEMVRDAWENRDQLGRRVQFLTHAQTRETDGDGSDDQYVVDFEDRSGTTLQPQIEITFRNYQVP